jgi:hypothetical protein
MARSFANYGQRPCAASAPETIVTIVSAGSNLKRAAIYQRVFGSVATPADNALLFESQHFSAAGTGTTTTAPTRTDNGDSAADCTATQLSTTDPTYTSNLILGYWPLNQRATHVWNAFDEKTRHYTIMTTSYGIGEWVYHASFTGNVSCCQYFSE